MFSEILAVVDRRQSQSKVKSGKGLDSYKAFSKLWAVWQISGIYPKIDVPLLFFIYSLVINVFFTIGAPVSLWINIFKNESMKALIASLSITMTFTLVAAKYFMVMRIRRQLFKAHDLLKPLDRRCEENLEDRRHIENGIQYSNKIFYFYMYLFSLPVIGFSIVAAAAHVPVYDSWFPPIFDSPVAIYWSQYVFHLLSQVVALVQNVNNDMYPLVYIVMMVSHLKALSERLTRLGMDNTLSNEETMKELLNCILDHKNIMAYFDCIRSVISSTISLQLLLSGFILCLTAINFLTFDHDLGQVLSTGIYLCAVIMETLPCCYYVNVLNDQTNFLTTAIYNSNWYNQNQKFRKYMIIFMQRTQKTSIIDAGGVAPITLQTFVAIIKFSFSLFTILSGMRVA